LTPLSTAFLYEDDIGVTLDGSGVVVGLGVGVGFGVELMEASLVGLVVGFAVGLGECVGFIVGAGVAEANIVAVTSGVLISAVGIRIGATV
jgi:hypothetical protein